jgi:hypothetical protein
VTAGRLALAAVAGALLLATAAIPAPTPAGSTIYRVRPDPRMCPSPLCGGFWVTRVNRSTTVCGDGVARVSCYVAGIVPAGAARSREDQLVRGRIVRTGERQTRPVDQLVATQAWLPATHDPAVGTVYLVRDTGIRCIRAPCLSLRAETVNTTRTTAVSGLDLSGAAAAPVLTRAAQAMLRTRGLLVAGSIRREADGGRTIVATQFFLATG